MYWLKRWWLHWKDQTVLVESILTSLIVGTTLIFVTQGYRILRTGFDLVMLLKAGLTYLVPYCVSSFTAVRTQMRIKPGKQAIKTGEYRCESCLVEGVIHDEILTEDEIVPECDNFGQKTEYVLRRVDGNG